MPIQVLLRPRPISTRVYFNSEVVHSGAAPSAAQAVMDTAVGTTIQTDTHMEDVDVAVGSVDEPTYPMPDQNGEYTMVSDKWYKVGTYSWDTTMTSGQTLTNLALPADVLVNQQLKQGFDNFYYWRGDVELKVVCNSTPWHSGLLRVVWFPSTTKQVYDTYRPANDLTMLTNIKGGWIYANNPSVVQMTCGFVSPKNYISTSGYSSQYLDASFGVFGIHVFEPLLAGTGTTPSVDVSVYAHLPISKFYLPVGFSTVSLDVVHSKIGRAVNTTTAILGRAVRFASVVKDGLGVLGLLDHGADPVPARPQIAKPYGYLNCVNEPVYIDKFAIDSRELAPSYPMHFSTKVDECEFKHMLSEPAFFKRVVWTPTDAVGTQLFSGLITPCMQIANVLPSVPVNGTKLTSCDYVALPHEFWRGPIDLNFKLVTTGFAAGSLRISALYGSWSDTVTDDAANSQYFTIIDLQKDQREYDIRLSFPSATMWKRVLDSSRMLTTGAAREKYGVGMFYVHVTNALTVANGAPPSVSILMSVSGEDLQFAVPHVPKWKISGSPVLPGFLAYDSEEEGEVVHSGSGSPGKSRRVVLGKDDPEMSIQSSFVPILSARDLSRRQYLVDQVNSTGSTYAVDPINLLSSGSPMAYWAGAFAGRRGGLRFKLQASSANLGCISWIPSVTVATVPYSSPAANAFHQVMFNPAHVAEVETSFTTELNYLCSTYAIANSSLDLSGCGFLQWADVRHTSGTYAFSYFFGGADDYRLGIYLGPPQVDVV